MRHLAQNFKKKFKGKVYDENLWPVSYTCNKRKHEHHLRVLYAENPLVKQYMDADHGMVWSRSKFNEICKVDYVTSRRQRNKKPHLIINWIILLGAGKYSRNNIEVRYD